MTADRVCAYRGLLVDSKTRVLTDPCEYYHPGVWLKVGCGRLRCQSCDQWVRSGPPGLGLNDEVKSDARALYAATDWKALPFVEERNTAFSPVRLHACACRIWEATRVDALDNDHESESDPSLPWACAGHPIPALPIALTDLTIDARTDAAELVAKVLGGSCPRPLDRPEAIGPEPAIWLTWLYVYLQGLPIADELSSAIANRIDDSDPLVVGRSLYFFLQFPRARGIERLVARAEADIHRLTVGYAIPEAYSAVTLWSVLVARLEHAPKVRDALDTQVDALVRRALVVPLSSLPHDDLGPASTVDYERQRRSRLGWKPDTLTWHLDDFAKARQRERTDTIARELARSPGVFDAPDMRVFVAEHIAEIDAAAPGRWRDAMTLLTDWMHKPEQGHLIVVAGARIIRDRLAKPDELRAWIEARRAYGWVDDAWVLPLETMLQQS